MKLLSIVLCLFVSVNIVKPNITTAESSLVYAYMSEDCILYKIENSEYTPLVTLPKTYFVAIMKDFDEYYQVNYLDITGFIKKTDLEIVDYEPVYKYASPSFTPSNDGFGVNLRSAPMSSAAILLTIENTQTALYYGAISGEAINPALGDKWCYSRFTLDSVVHYGYVYRGHIRADEIPPNKIEKVEKNPEPPGQILPSPPEFTSLASILFIVGLSVPAIVIMLLLFKRPPKRVPRHREK